MKTLKEIIEIAGDLEWDNELIEQYKISFSSIVHSETDESLHAALQNNPKLFFSIAPLLCASWFSKKNMLEIYNLLVDYDLTGKSRHLDFFNGKLIQYYYYSLKHLDKPIDSLYKFLFTNREYRNKYTVAILTNCILDYQINTHNYEIIDEEIEDSEERCKYYFYLGIIYLVKGDFSRAIKYFDDSDVLNTSSSMEIHLKKYIIICKLHLGNSAIFYPYQDELQPYFALIGAVKRGDVSAFYNLLEENQKEYYKMNLYFVVRRLLKIIIQEGLRKITYCYSRIKVKDICEILGFQADYFLYKTIRDGEIKGFVQDEIFYSQFENRTKLQCGENIRKAVEVRKNALKAMKYPEIVPLTFERLRDSGIVKE